MCSRSFGIIENRVGPVLLKLMEELLIENIEEEVKATFKAAGYPDDDFDKWKNGDLAAKLKAGTDMGWQGRGSKSLSGHAFFCGFYSRKVILWMLLCTKCNICVATKTHGKTDDPEHKCTKNWNGSAKSMEANAVLMMYLHLYEKHKVHVVLVIADDDSSIKSKLRWNNKDYKANHGLQRAPQIVSRTGKSRPCPNLGKVPGNVPVPSFGADPNHRTKLVGKAVYSLARRSIKEEKLMMTEMHAYRLKRNYGFLV